MNRRDLLAGLLPVASAGILKGANIPRPAPELVIEMPNGRPPLKLSQYKGKVIALEFILTYCSHCQRASRTTELIYRQFKSRGFQPVAAAIDPTGDPTRYSQEQNVTFPVGKVTQQTCVEYLQHPIMARLLMPQLVLIDRNFQIVAQYSGDNAFFGDNEEKNMREAVEKLIGGASQKKTSGGGKS